MVKNFSLTYLYEPLESFDTFATKRMFGGMAIYVHGRMVLHIAEDEGSLTYRDQKFDFDIWNGLLVVTGREFHESLFADFPQLINHPVLPKWLYLPVSHTDFESVAEGVLEAIRLNDERIGIYPKPKKQRKKKTSKKKA